MHFSRVEAEMKRQYVIEGTRSIMGTSVTITLTHSDVKEAKEALSFSFREMHKIEDLMSIYKGDSEVSVLNRRGFLEDASAETVIVIEKAIHYSRLSGGAFSPAVLPILDLWDERLKTGRFPTETEIKGALDMADYRNILIEDGKIRFNKNGMRITLGGIAKGYAVDKAVETLRQKGIKHALVNAGGDIRAMGGKVEGIPWRIAVRDPNDKRRSVAIVELYDKAIATSGSYERHIGKDLKVSHIMNGKTGQPAQGLMSTTIIAGEAVDADALSTIVFILGAEKGMNMVESLKNVEALIITKDNAVLKSSGFRCCEDQRAR